MEEFESFVTHMHTFNCEFGLFDTLVVIPFCYSSIYGVSFPIYFICQIRRKSLGSVSIISLPIIVSVFFIAIPKESYGPKNKCLVP